MRPSSLRRVLLWSLLGTLLTVFVVGGSFTYMAALRETDRLMDYHLRQLALSLRDRSFNQPTTVIGVPDESFDFVIQIWDSRGVQLYLSRPHSTLPAISQQNFSTVRTPDSLWRAYAVFLPDRVIQVAQPMSVRSRAAAQAALHTLIPLMVLVPLLGILVWWLVGRSLRPLARLTREVAQRRPDSLEALSLDAVPEEILPLAAALNALLDRLDQALSAQRAFVADAAHELRTPLAALQIQLQLLERAPDAASRAAALTELRSGLQRSNHLVGQLLTLARLEPGSPLPGGEMAPLALAALVRSVLAERASLAVARRQDLGADELDDTLQVRADRHALHTLIANLVDNALRYTPDGGRIDIAVRAQVDASGAAWARLCVDDSGPGVPPAERLRVLDRFYRPPGQAQSGSGLGLAIVASIARRHDARLELGESALGGLRVWVDFPLPTHAA